MRRALTLTLSRRERGPDQPAAVLHGFRADRSIIISLLLLALAMLLRPATAAAQDDAGPNEPNNLRLVRTVHYDIHTDLDPTLVAELAKRMDTMYDQYCVSLKQFSPPANAPRLPAYIFRSHSEYMAFTMYQAANTGGIFMIGPRTCLAAFLEGQGRDNLRRTLQHEAFHQFAYFTISKHLPIWLNEGLAQLFEEGIWDGQRFWLGEIPPRRVRQLLADKKARTLVPFKQFMAITPEEWIRTLTHNAEKGATYYNQAWAMVQFLSQGGGPAYMRRFAFFLQLLHQGDDSDSAFRAAFPAGTTALERDVSAWASDLKPTPRASMLERQDTLGDFLVALAGRGMHFANIMQFRNEIVGRGYQLEYTRGHITWTTEDSPEIYFCNLRGMQFPPQDLYFQPAQGAPLPDIVCQAMAGMQCRTHFYRSAGKIEHEELIEAEMD